MTNRRARTYAFYKNPSTTRGILLEKSASAAGEYAFRGPALKQTAVVRVDLNDYSAWVRDREIAARVKLLDAFFSQTMPKLADAGGIFFRDEGDCIVCLFSDYFQTAFTPTSIFNFCKSVASTNYPGVTLGDSLTAKVSVAWGPVAYFQKAHEAGSEDWSAEGDPFVRAVRLEQAIESKQQIVFYADEYDRIFTSGTTYATSGTIYHWQVERRKLQVSGLQLSGGWAEVVSLEYLPGGRVQT